MNRHTAIPASLSVLAALLLMPAAASAANRDRCVGGASKDHAKQCERKASI
jgi:hypothetical protein